jgi:tetratricopeptide (TPR) repeat protein
LGQAASLSAQDAFDESLQTERLDRALVNYRNAIQWASPESDKALILRAHAAMGRILAFQDKTAEAAKEFDAAIALGPVDRAAYNEAVAGRKSLNQSKQ